MRLTLQLACLTWATLGLGTELEVIRRAVSEMPAIELKSAGKLNLKLVPECSALWASQGHRGVLWTLSDSGNKPAIVPIRADGSAVITPKGLWGAVKLQGATNVDWEAMTGDAAGNMIVGDVGNNVSLRKELRFYLFKEPAPGVTEVTELRKVTFVWPDQTAFPDPELSHDCEAIFLLRGKIYLLTKHRRDTLTDLWRAEIPATGERATLTKLARFDAGGMVTDACVSPDQKRLAILTYRNVWVFDVPTIGEDFFHAPALYAPISPPTLSWQVEGCSWVDSGHLLIGSEQGDLFRIALTDLREAK
jgi:hypothetical protein